MRVPKDHPVKPLRAGTKAFREAENLFTCGTCGRSWDDAVVTGMTPTPSGRCPFEYYHTLAGKPRHPIMRESEAEARRNG